MMSRALRRTTTSLVIDVGVVVIASMLLGLLTRGAVSWGSSSMWALTLSIVWFEYNWAGVAKRGRTWGYAVTTRWVNVAGGRWWRSGVRAVVGPVALWAFMLSGGRGVAALLVLGVAIVFDREAEVACGRSFGDLLARSHVSDEPLRVRSSWHLGKLVLVLTLVGVVLGVGEVATGHHLPGTQPNNTRVLP